MPKNFAIEYQRILTAMSLLSAVEDSDYTKKHTLRTGRLVREMCDEMEFENEEDKTTLIRAAYFHDVGKIKLPKNIVFKVGELTDDEYEMIKLHPKYGYDILQELKLYDEADLVLHHHERLDGSGYPNGIKGDEFELKYQILAVADVYDAMTTNRPYHKLHSGKNTLLYLYSVADKYYSLSVVKLLHRALEKNKIIGKSLDI